MENLPGFGDRLHVWPAKGRKVQRSEVSITEGGSFMPADGIDIAWSSWWHRQLLAGAIHLHDPKPVFAAPPSSSEPATAAQAEAAASATKLAADAKRAELDQLRDATKQLEQDVADADRAAAAAGLAAAAAGRKLATQFTASAPAVATKSEK